MPAVANARITVCLALTRAISRTRTVEEIYSAALDALADGLGVSRASILLFDPDGVMRFKAYRGLSDEYRRAVEGHSPWRPDTEDPSPVVVSNVEAEPSLAPFIERIRAEGIAAMAFIPLVSLGRVIGKFMLYYDTPHELGPDELQLAGVIGAQVAFAVERTQTHEQVRRNEERLRFALEAAAMGTWDWDVTTGQVRWSENLERLHGLPQGTFGGTFTNYEREIHPDDRGRVLASVQRALAEGVPHDVEYRIVGPDGSIRWVEGKGQVEYRDGKPVGMTGVCMLVTRRKEAELARLAAAEEASRLKDEFLATLSHELRTPLNAVLGWVQMLESGTVRPDRTRQAIEVIGRNAKLQAQLIEDILDVSRIIAGKLEIERRPLLVPHLVEMAVQGVLPAAEAKRVRVSTDIAADVPPIEGDPRRLQQVLGNVLSNAVKFTPEGGHVSAACRTDGDAILVEIRDSGVGIPEDFLPFVFDRFRQADCRTTRKHGGLGLGLAIARHLVERHHGEIRVESGGPGQGAAFKIRLPASVAVAHPPAADARGTALALWMPRRLSQARVLVVDDQPDSRELLAALLDRCGARVSLCEGAAEALERIAAEPVDLLVADIAMPECDGYSLLAQVRRTHPTLPAVAVSAYARFEDRERAFAAGYGGYCPKPVEAGAFLRLVDDVLGQEGRGAARLS